MVFGMFSVRGKWCVHGSPEDFDPRAALEDLHLEVLEAKCFKQCKRGPNVRVVHEAAPQGAVVAGMTSKEVKHRCFHEVDSLEAARRVAALLR